ncbi:autophagy-related protein 13a-like isoform X1 [Lolium rigidum]|uniref:autophagy-related protein 13a-like isoform X1 n=1 Tax=Lolium rigidum TaxID=89674 RepID=UPI001F5C9C83|nr:autophagy-related protein 13a-like isoform X1 [Lolium rigidum]
MSSMSDSGGGGRAGAELMAEQFHLKVLHAVLAVRSPRPLAAPAPPAAASASFRRRDRWFHLPLHDPPPPPSAERLEAPAPGEPLVVDIHLAPAGNGGAGGEVVERWTVACEPWPDAAAAGEGIAVNRAYKRCMTLLRAVYATLRLLPAYRVFHVLRRASDSYNYEMGYRVGSFAVPFSRDQEAAMRSRRFVPVDTQPGRLVVSVQYLSSLAGFKLEISSLSPSMLIPNYAVSPAAEPMRAFPASLTEATGSAFPQSYQHHQRPHSWAQPALWPHAPAQQTRFSPPPLHYASPTPSPPNFPGGYLQSPLRGRGESAPMTIPGERRSPVHRQNMLDPMLPPPSPRRGDKGAAGSQESPSDISRSFGRLRIGDQYGSLSPGSKGKDSKDESGRFSALSSCDSPRQDDLDDADYPFAVDDVDPPISRPGSSDGKEARDQSGSSSHKSQDAAVGSLVNLLKSARPLRDSSYSSQSGAESNVAGSTSSGMSRRTSDALEELQSFKAIRERLLSGSRAKDGQSPETP